MDTAIILLGDTVWMMYVYMYVYIYIFICLHVYTNVLMYEYHKYTKPIHIQDMYIEYDMYMYYVYI